MKRLFKSGALAWGIAAALMAFPTNGVAADNNSAVCNLLATGNVYAADQCRQENTATNTQSATATGGNGGTATGGNAGPVQVVGDGSEGSSYGGNAYANGGDAEASNSLENEQSNQISGRDSSGSGYVGTATTTPEKPRTTPESGDNRSDVCKQLATLDAQGNDQCHQSNTTTNTQTATATGGNGGTATGGNGGPVQVVGDESEGGSYGGNAYANGGDAEASNSLENEQSNQISGRDSSGSGYVGDGGTTPPSATCWQPATSTLPTSAGRRTPPPTPSPRPRPAVTAVRRPVETPAPCRSWVTDQRAARTEATRTRTAATPRRPTASRTSSPTRSPGVTARGPVTSETATTTPPSATSWLPATRKAMASATRATPLRAPRPRPRPAARRDGDRWQRRPLASRQ